MKNIVKKKIVLILPVTSGGGAEQVGITFLKSLIELDYELHLIVLSKQKIDSIKLPADIQTHVLGHMRLLRALPSLIICLKKIRPNIVFSTHGYVNVAIVALKFIFFNKTRLIIREANTPSQAIRNQPFGNQISWLCKLLYKRADAIICQSKKMQYELENDYSVPSPKLHLIYNPTNELFLRSECKPARVKGSGRRFVAMGTFTYKKGFDRLLEWFAKMPADSHLSIFGDGPERQKLLGLIRRLGLDHNVSLPGFVDRPWDHISGADAFLLSSRWEGMPNVVLEALACGVPTIAMEEAGGVSDIKELAEKDAITLCSNHNEFLTAMKKIKAKRNTQQLNPSFLPSEFQERSSTSKFCHLVQKTVEQT